MSTLLEVHDLKTQFKTDHGLVKAVDGISYVVDEQEVIGLVGESGCGKSVSQLSVMQLIFPPGKVVEGRVLFEGKDVLTLQPGGPVIALHPWRKDRYDLSGADDVTQSGFDDWGSVV